MDEQIYEEKIFKESEILEIRYNSENPVSEWVNDTLNGMLRNYRDRDNNVYYQISIERFDSDEDLKNAQALKDQFI